MLHNPLKYNPSLFANSIHLTIFAILTLLHSNNLTGQQSLICKTSIQISVNDHCEAEVKPELLLKNHDPYVDYGIELKDAKGEAINGLILNLDYLGQELTATVTHAKNKISCWTKILVESKIFPEFAGCHDITISCHAYPDTLQYMSSPEISGSQCGVYTMSFEDRVEEHLCSTDGFSQIVFRQWTLLNESGFEFNCTQRILVKRPTIDNVYFPPHFNNEEYQAISCDYVLYDNDSIAYEHKMNFIEGSTPSIKDFPYGTGAPGGQFCGNMKVNFNDTYYPSCGNQIKILRRWNIIDWCTDQDKVKDQIIEVVDDRGPILRYTTENRIINVDYESCLSTIKSVPYPIEVHDCSETTYSISYKYKQLDGKMSGEINTGISTNPDASYRIEEIPSDSVMIIYHVYDDCSHYSTCEIPYSLIDNQAPVAICEQRTVVTLNENGHTEIWASTLQHHSVDNCEIVYQEIKRKHEACDGFDEDLEFGEKISFCCSDIGDKVYDISLRVYDAHGNFADCHSEIVIQDKIKPLIIECVPHKIIECHEDYLDMDLMGGEPEVHDNCGMNIEYSDDLSALNSCGFGTIYRNWKATDNHGNWSDCMQEISIKSETLSSASDIIWPRTKTLTECIHSNISSDVLGEPQLPYEECAQISFNYEDQVFYEESELCMKILRNWTVIDWCRYDPGAEFSQGYWTNTQVIKLSDTTKPTFESSCENIAVRIPDDECFTDVQVNMIATDDCSLDKLKYHYTIISEEGDIIDEEGAELSQQLISGIHEVVYSVSDGCGNKDDCEFKIEVLQENNLQLICINGVSLSLGATGETEIWASDFIKEVNSNCFDTDAFDFSFSLDSVQSSIFFNCDNFDQFEGTQKTEELKVFVIDHNGHSGSCIVELIITDNFNICTAQTNHAAIISGHVLLESGRAMPNKMVTLNNMSQNTMLQEMTSNNGLYTFETELYEDYKIYIDVNGIVLDGLSTLDLIQIQKHILGQTRLDSPYKLIAADIDQSESISVSDLIYLRKLILGIDTQLPRGHVWTFVDRNFKFFNPLTPWDFPKENYLTNLSQDEMNKDFIAVKLGDVNLSYSDKLEQRNDDELNLVIESNDKSNGLVEYSFKPSVINDYLGFQLSLHFASQILQFDDIQDEEGNSISESNYTVIDDNIIISYFNNDLSKVSKNNSIFSIKFRKVNKLSNENVIQLNTHFENEIYTNSLDIVRIRSLEERVDDLSTLKIIESYPNPFISETNIMVYSEINIPTKIKVYNALGQEVYSKSFISTGGYEKIAISLPKHLNSGLFYCRIENKLNYDIIQIFKAGN